MVHTAPGLSTILSSFPLSLVGVLMMIGVAGKLQGGHISVISVPWEGTRCSETDTLSCLAEILMITTTELRICGTWG